MWAVQCDLLGEGCCVIYLFPEMMIMSIMMISAVYRQ